MVYGDDRSGTNCNEKLKYSGNRWKPLSRLPLRIAHVGIRQIFFSKTVQYVICFNVISFMTFLDNLITGGNNKEDCCSGKQNRVRDEHSTSCQSLISLFLLTTAHLL